MGRLSSRATAGTVGRANTQGELGAWAALLIEEDEAWEEVSLSTHTHTHTVAVLNK